MKRIFTLVVLTFISCESGVGRDSGTSSENAGIGAEGTFAIDGIALDMTPETVRRILGNPTGTRGPYTTDVTQDSVVTWTYTGTVIDFFLGVGLLTSRAHLALARHRRESAAVRIELGSSGRTESRHKWLVTPRCTTAFLIETAGYGSSFQIRSSQRSCCRAITVNR